MQNQTSTKLTKKRPKIAKDSYPTWFPWKRYLLLGFGLAAGLTWGLSAWSRIHNSKADRITHLSERLNLPPELEQTENTLRLSCPKRLSPYRIAKTYYDYSRIYSTRKYEEALVAQNPEVFADKECDRTESVLIPGPVLAPITNRPLGWPRTKAVKAIYMRGDNLLPMRTAQEVALIKKRGLNAIVFDVKDILGVVNYRSSVPEVEAWRHHPPPIPSLPKTIRYLHQNGIYVIARMALFQDRNLAEHRPGLAIRDAASPNGKLLVKGHPLWVDPAHPIVKKYNLAIVDELVRLGVDEIQFDYVRYPAEGDLSQVSYLDVKKADDKTRHLVDFLSAAWLRTRLSGTRTSIDIFGIVAWGEEVDIRATGQRISHLSPWVDVISPMLYPSHFNRGFDGFVSPADEGFHFYERGVRKVLEHSRKANPLLVVRPWIQAFKWRVTNYNEKYILDQIRGSYLGGGNGWLMWNASNQYAIVYRALKNGHPEGQTDTGRDTPEGLTLE